MDMEAEDHQAHTDHHQWAAMGVEEAEGDRLHLVEDGEGGAEDEGGVDAEAETSGTDRAHTRDLGAGVRAGACHDHHTANRHHEHHHAEGAAEVAMADEIHRLEEEEGAAVEGEAQAMTRTTVLGQGAGAESAGSSRICWLAVLDHLTTQQRLFTTMLYGLY
jgi:hypothetical protein